MAGGISVREPPLHHASARWNGDAHALEYEYNGRNAVKLPFGIGREPIFRQISDGDICSTPMMQHMTITLPEEAWIAVEFELSPGSVNMRPCRAESGEAVLGQLGGPLIYGANGMYDVNDDLLISWHGRPWRWVDEAMQDYNGSSRCKMEVLLGPVPWVLLFRMQYYRMHLGFAYHTPWLKRPDPRAITGWCSWEAYHDEIVAAHISTSAAFLKKKFKDFGLEYVQIDDGYQQSPQPPDADGDYSATFLQPNDKFPRGHRNILEPIRRKGLKPGIWVSAGITNAEFARKSPFVVKGPDGTPLRFDWLGYCMDCSEDSLRTQVLPLYEGLRSLGYRYIKADTLRHMYLDGLRGLIDSGGLTNDEAQRHFRAYMETARKGMGDEMYFVACWGMLPEVAGIADACRIASDSGPEWSRIRMQLYEMARWYHTQRILFTNDPDHICVRADLEYARSALSLTALSGGLMMLSDTVDQYDAGRTRMIRHTLPALETMAAETGAVDCTMHAWGRVLDWDAAATGEVNPFGSLWCMHFIHHGRKWAVACRVAIEPLRRCRISLDRLGLDPGMKYAAYDFWAGRYLGVAEGGVRFKELPRGHCQVIGLNPVADTPFVLASSRHVSMDAVSILSESYSNGILNLKLAGIRRRTFSYTVWVPPGMELKDISADGATVSAETKKVLRLRVTFSRREAELTLVFQNRR